jgi:hypothetical protein
MKKIIFLTILMFGLALTSCSSESGVVSIENEPKVDASGRLLGTIPGKHNIYKGLLVEYDLDKFDELYRTEFAHPDSLLLDYSVSVRAVSFFLMMEKGLAQKGTMEQKLYYLDQQLKMEENIPDTERVYALLASLKESDEKLASDLEKQFYERLRAISPKEFDTGIATEALKQGRKSFRK